MSAGMRNRLLAVTMLLAVHSFGAVAQNDQVGERSATDLMDALMWNREPVGGSFDLIDHTGKPRTDTDFRGQLLLVYFGYTYCPDQCPTDLQAIAQALDQLGPAADAIQPLFITLDPERDTAEHLADYVAAFHPKLVGLTGAPEAIRRVALAYKVYYRKAPGAENTDYAVDHTSFIYLVDAAGHFLGFLPPGTSADRLTQVVREHIPSGERVGQSSSSK